jgi:arabinofuranosyltransferase
MFLHPATSPDRALGRLRAVIPWAVLGAAALFWLLWRGHEGALVDDAFISFRYAARWASGAGLTWNDGAAVEGFSNPLWTLLLGVLARLGVAPHVAAPGLGLLALLGTVVTAGALARRRGLSGIAQLILVGGLALDVGFATWAGSGLETASCALLVTAWLWAAAGLTEDPRGGPGAIRGGTLGLLGSALALSRPEGAVWALWGLIWLLWGAWAPKRVLAGWLLGLAPALAYGVFRWLTYGQLVPNTFFAKMEPTGSGSLTHAGADLGGWAVAHAVPLALVVLLGLFGRAGKRRPDGAPAAPRFWLLLPAGWVALQWLFVLAAGGDWMGRSRYLVPVLPALYLLAAEVWPVRGPLASVRGRAILLPLLAAHLALGWIGRDVIPDYTLAGREIGLWLRSAAEPGDMVAVTAAGAIPYFSGLAAYDILGINDAEVAGRPPRHTGPWAPGHHRYDLDRLLEIRPRWIVWDFGIRINEHRLRELRDDAGDPDRLDYRRALLARPAFRSLYTVDPGVPASTQRAYTVFRLR